MAREWKKGRGKLGVLKPILGRWRAEAESPMGTVRCTRMLEPVLNGSYVQLTARWEFGGNPERAYQEIALIGAGAEGKISFWSFTSDGKRSEGALADGADVHPQALCFEAQMPAGLARMLYWPDDGDGFFWAVESKTQKGWNRFTLHHYYPLTDAEPE